MHRLNEIDKHDKSGHRNFDLQKQNAISMSLENEAFLSIKTV